MLEIQLEVDHRRFEQMICKVEQQRQCQQRPAASVHANPAHEYTKSLIEAAPGRNWDFANFRALEGAAHQTGDHA